MAQPTNERTLISAIIPKDVVHTHSTTSIVFESYDNLLYFAGCTHSIVYDFIIRLSGKSNIYSDALSMLPLPRVSEKHKKLILSRTLRLNCLTKHYSELWEKVFEEDFKNDSFFKNDHRLSSYNQLSKKWEISSPFRNPYERRLALIELDVLVGLAFELTIDELITIYNVQFPTLKINDEETYYDQKGNIVFTVNRNYTDVGLKRKDWEKIRFINTSDELDEEFKCFVPPFHKCNREEDMRQAYEYFSKILKENS